MSHRLTIESGIPGGEQRDSFQNATLQSCAGGAIDFSIAIHVDLDQFREVVSEEEAAARLAMIFAPLVAENGHASVDIQIGPGEALDGDS